MYNRTYYSAFASIQTAVNNCHILRLMFISFSDQSPKKRPSKSDASTSKKPKTKNKSIKDYVKK